MVEILNVRGEPIRQSRKEVRAEANMEYAGIGMGRDITRGYISESHYLHPQDKVLRYQGAHNYELYEDLLQDDRVYSTFAQRRSAVVAREWAVEPGGTMRRDKLAAEHIKEVLHHVRWDTVTDMMLYGVFYGYSVAEMMWTRDGRYVAVDRIKVRNRRRFVFDEEFRPMLLTTDQAWGGRLPERKFWHFATGADNDDEPYGRGLGYYLYWPVWFKKNHMRFWVTFNEKYATPTPVGKYPRGASPGERQRLMSAVRALQTDTGIAIPESMIIELIEAKRSGGGDSYNTFYERMQETISTIVVSQTMTTTDGSSLAQAKVHMEVRGEVVESDADLVDDSFNRGPVKWLTEWNYPGAATPRVRRIMENPEALAKLATRDKAIVDMGHRLTADYIEETYQVEVDRRAAGPQPAPPTEAELAEDEDDTVDLLRESTRNVVGPMIDRWIDTVREQLDNSDSLGGFRERLGEVEIDVEGVARVLGRAFAVAVLAGRYDVEETSVEVEFAEAASVEFARLPFLEQISFFREKLSLPTAAWTDIFDDGHDKGFVVAGAAKEELLADLRAAVDQAIADGTTLATFRERFDEAVSKHGWSYNGGRDWRTRVIYDTNLRTSYSAGRWQQLQAVKARRPYWRYRHSDASEHPRELHVQWDGLILHADDPWWRTNYPPNGWGCKCYVEALSERDLRRLGKSGPDRAPALEMRTVTVGSGASARTVTVPAGVDPGFGYAPGRSV